MRFLNNPLIALISTKEARISSALVRADTETGPLYYPPDAAIHSRNGFLRYNSGIVIALVKDSTMSDELILVPNEGWDDRILVANCGPLVNVFIILTQRYVVLVDTLINPVTATTLLEIARPYLPGRQLLAVNTHADWDHAWGNQVFAGSQALYPAPVIGTRLCAERIRSPEAAQTLASMREREPERFGDVQLVPPTIVFEERLTIDGGDLTLHLFATPGHQPDHISLYIPEIQTLLAGDSAEVPFPFSRSAQDLPVLRDSLARMEALQPAYALYCHAPVTAGPELLRQNSAYFNELERRCAIALVKVVPSQLPADADFETLAGFPFADAIPTGMTVTQPEFYRPGHQAAIRMMLEYLVTL